MRIAAQRLFYLSAGSLSEGRNGRLRRSWKLPRLLVFRPLHSVGSLQPAIKLGKKVLTSRDGLPRGPEGLLRDLNAACDRSALCTRISDEPPCRLAFGFTFRHLPHPDRAASL